MMIFGLNCDIHIFNCKQLICLQLHLISLVNRWFISRLKAGPFVILFILLYSLLAITKAAPINRSQLNQSLSNIDNAIGFLSKFGYIPKASWTSSSLISEKYLRDSIKSMQRFGNIPQTGLLDKATIELMNRKRCGVPDIIAPDDPLIVHRFKRYIIQGSKWSKTNLTWSVKVWPSNLDNKSTLTELTHAFSLWSQKTILKFNQNPNADQADIVISFLRGKHGDSYAFDGPGGVLAHAFFPGDGIGGDVHFDDDEHWTKSDVINKEESVGLFDVAAHELGHSLGLKHSNVNSSLMFPYYSKLSNKFTLPEDDLRGIIQIYEKDVLIDQNFSPEETPLTTHKPRHQNETSKTINDYNIPKTCETDFDAVSSIRGETFFFKGKYFWRIDNNKKLERNYPIEVTYFWRNLSNSFDKIDAVYERPIDKKIIFFIGQQFWVFTTNTLDTGFPKPISILGLPQNLTHIDAAMVWGHNGKTYFFSGNQYWRFNEAKMKVELDYPRNIAVWEGVPANIDAAFQWHRNGINYFFKKDKYWEFNNRKMATYKSSPKNAINFWFSSFCRTTPNGEDFLFQRATNPNISYASSAQSVNCHLLTNTFTFIFILFIIIRYC